GSQRHDTGHVEGADDFARGAKTYAITQSDANQRVVYQSQALTQRCTHVINKLHRRSTGTAFRAVDDDEIGSDVGFEHGLGHGEPFPGVAYAKLEADGLAAG